MSQRAWDRQVKAFGRGPINNKEIGMEREKPPMMECGHAANAKNSEGEPACVICIGMHPGAEKVVDGPDLTGRTAKCAYSCGSTKPSSTSLPFFEYQGPGSNRAKEVCKCGYRRIAHGKADVVKRKQGICAEFTPCGGAEHDQYYCGCRGWD